MNNREQCGRTDKSAGTSRVFIIIITINTAIKYYTVREISGF
jgi:hypothetical protein